MFNYDSSVAPEDIDARNLIGIYSGARDWQEITCKEKRYSVGKLRMVLTIFCCKTFSPFIIFAFHTWDLNFIWNRFSFLFFKYFSANTKLMDFRPYVVTYGEDDIYIYIYIYLLTSRAMTSTTSTTYVLNAVGCQTRSVDRWHFCRIYL